jgi:hypothetical protein
MACNYCIRIMMGWYVLSKSHALRCIWRCFPWHPNILI